MSLAKSIVKNSFYLYTGDIIGKVLTFVMIILLARHYGAEDFGRFSFAMALTTLLYFAIDFGTNRYFVRSVASDKKKFRRLFNQCMSQKIVFGLVFVPILTLIIHLAGKDAKLVLLVFLFAVSVMINSLAEFLKAVFRSYEKMMYESILKIVERVLWLVGALLIIAMVLELYSLGLLLILSSVVNLAVGLFFATRLRKIGYSFDFSFTLLKIAVPFAVSSAFFAIYYRIALIFLSFVHGDAATGIYNAGFQFIEALIAIPFIFQSALFPVFSRTFSKARGTYLTILKKSLKILIMISFPIVVGTVVLARDIILLFFGSSYSAAIPVLQILMLSIIAVFISVICVPFLMAGKKEKILAYSILGLLVFNILLNAVLVPMFSTIGAAVATVVTDFIFAGLLLFFVYRLIGGFPIGWYFFKIGIASVMMGLVVYFVPVHFILKVLIGAFSYLLLVILFRVLSGDDWLLLKGLVPGGAK